MVLNEVGLNCLEMHFIILFHYLVLFQLNSSLQTNGEKDVMLLFEYVLSCGL